MSKRSSKSKQLVKMFEEIIDARFKYLKELEHENHSYARKILENNYDPAVEKFLEALKKRA